MKQIAALIVLPVVVLVLAGQRTSVSAQQDLKPQVERYWKAWQSGPDAAAPLYAKDAGLVFYDLEPLKYTGWNDYKAFSDVKEYIQGLLEPYVGKNRELRYTWPWTEVKSALMVRRDR